MALLRFFLPCKDHKLTPFFNIYSEAEYELSSCALKGLFKMRGDWAIVKERTINIVLGRYFNTLCNPKNPNFNFCSGYISSTQTANLCIWIPGFELGPSHYLDEDDSDALPDPCSYPTWTTNPSILCTI